MEGNLLTMTAALAMEVTLKYVRKGDFVIDATCGNGHDTLSLAKAVGDSGYVMAVDLQEQAIQRTEALLKGAGIRQFVTVQGNFLYLREYAEKSGVQREPAAAVFNLGYLPGGDKSLTTKAEDTLEAVQKALSMIKTGGIVTVVMYPGHCEGKREMDMLLLWAETLASKKYHTVYASLPNQKNNPPQILWITKKK